MQSVSLHTPRLASCTPQLLLMHHCAAGEADDALQLLGLSCILAGTENRQCILAELRGSSFAMYDKLVATCLSEKHGQLLLWQCLLRGCS